LDSVFLIPSKWHIFRSLDNNNDLHSLEIPLKKYSCSTILITFCLAILATDAMAQRAGQSVTIRTGIVTGSRVVDLKDSNAIKGVLVGGAVGAAVTKSRKGSSRKSRNALIGAAVGGAVAASKRTEGRLYTVTTNEGTSIQIATEQTEIRIDDCVLVEESGGTANLRRTSAAACMPSSQPIMSEPAMIEEFQEEAADCTAVKNEFVVAETDEAMDRAIRKIQLLCYN
jgi:outer membrane lipoprotein SlyB